MSHTSTFYLLFLAAGASVYYLLPPRLRPLWLLSLSYLFYLTWQPAFLLVLIGVTIAAFVFGRNIRRAGEGNRLLMATAVIALLSPLVFFKYYNFLNESISHIFSSFFGSAGALPSQPYLIPLGISFFTFQAISYVADIYRGYLKPEKSFIRFAAYVAFFPTLLAGPIERARSILGQLRRPIAFEYRNVQAGLQLILWGVFKKVVIADRLTDFINTVDANPRDQQGVMVYLAIVFAVFQLFCDFSAYSDIAVGSGRMFGIRLSKNFDDRVYASPSREIFWRGWHRTLTSWLRDYVFFPLSHGVTSRSWLYVNLIFVYLLVGIWHNATTGAITWGFLNGIWLVLEKSTKEARWQFFRRMGLDTDGRLYNFLGWVIVFHLGALIWVVFRSASPLDAAQFIKHIGNTNAGLTVGQLRGCVPSIVLILLMDQVNKRIPKGENIDALLSGRTMLVRWVFYILLIELILRYSFVFDQVNFRYFNF